MHRMNAAIFVLASMLLYSSRAEAYLFPTAAFPPLSSFQSRHRMILSSRTTARKPPELASPHKVDVVVVGAGLCGSTAAFYLNKRGYDVVLAEQGGDVGGCVTTKQKDGFMWEEGANSFQPTQKILRVAKDMGMIDELVLANASLPRFIFWGGELKKLPSSVRALWDTDLLSAGGKARLLLGLLGGVAASKVPDKGDESIEEFATRHFGEEVFSRMVDPFVSGVYAGDPRQLSVQATLGKVSSLEAHGITRSVLEGALVKKFRAKSVQAPDASGDEFPHIPPGSLGSFKRGLQSLPLKVAAELGSKCKVSHSLEKLEPHQGGWLTTFKLGTTGKTKTYFSRAVLLTTPAQTSAKFLGSPLTHRGRGAVNSMPLAPAAAKHLREIKYPPVVGVYLAYPDKSLRVPLQGFGHLIPRANKIRSLGSIWCSSLFPGRAPEGHSLLLTFIGGAQDPRILELSSEEVVAQVDSDLRRAVVLPDAPPPRVISVKAWPRGIPQYNRGYSKVLQEVREGVQASPGLFLGGNFISGVSVGDCINFGSEVSSNISSYLLQSRFSYASINNNVHASLNFK